MKKYFLLLLILPVLALSACSLTKEETTVSEEVTVERHEFTAYDGSVFSYEGEEGFVYTEECYCFNEGDTCTYCGSKDDVSKTNSLSMSKSLSASSGKIFDVDIDKVKYACDGTFIKTGSVEEDNLRWAHCETNGKDYLKQFEYGSFWGSANCVTGGGSARHWNVVYSKNFEGQNYLFVSPLEDEYGHYWHSDDKDVNEFCTEDNVCYDFDSKEYLDYLLEDEKLQEKIAEWDKFVESIELVK